MVGGHCLKRTVLCGFSVLFTEDRIYKYKFPEWAWKAHCEMSN